MLEPYLKTLFTFCGMGENDLTFISVNNALAPDGADTGDEAAAARHIATLAETW